MTPGLELEVETSMVYVVCGLEGAGIKEDVPPPNGKRSRDRRFASGNRWARAAILICYRDVELRSAAAALFEWPDGRLSGREVW